MKILFLAQLPPPINGSTVVSQDIFNLLNEKEEIKKINIATTKDLKDYEKISILKIYILSKIFWQLTTSLIFNKFDCLYLTFTHQRDWIF